MMQKTKKKFYIFFQFQAKYKFAAWKKVVDEGLSASDAQGKYVTLVEKLKETRGFEA